MRFLGVDFGEARTGLALSDPLGISCRPLQVLRGRDTQVVVADILRVAQEEDVDTIVVGLPKPLSGGSNLQLKTVERFVGELKAHTHLPVDTWDERFTSRMARGSRPKGEPEDSVAACYMLQGYLDRRSQQERMDR